MAESTLKRSLNLPLLTFYGLGTIVGAGIYVLIGEVVSVSGTGVALAFFLAATIAALTGATYAELSARFPQSAGAVLFVDEAFAIPVLSQVVGIVLLSTGVVSAAAICQGFVGYFQLHVELPDTLVIFLLCAAMFGVASWGIRESAWLITIITLLEVGGLLLVIQQTSGLPQIGQATELLSFEPGTTILIGSFLAFYAFIGFEDMVNVAEEVIEPEKTMPRGILLAVLLSAGLYLGIAGVAVLFVDLTTLADSRSPLALMVGHSESALVVVSLISMVAIVNGALVQVIMAARVLYGMSNRSLLPAFFGVLNTRTQTPVLNTLLVVVVIFILASSISLVTLAKITSAAMLVIFVVANLSLVTLKRSNRHDVRAYNGFTVPILIPVLGAVCAIALLLAQIIL